MTREELEKEYDYVGDFTDGLARVEKDGKWGYIDRKGTVVIDLIYDFVGYFHEGLVGVKKDGKYGFLDREGNVVIELIYDDVTDFSDDIAEVELDGEWFYIDRQGNRIGGKKMTREELHKEYDYVKFFSEGRATFATPSRN